MKPEIKGAAPSASNSLPPPVRRQQRVVDLHTGEVYEQGVLTSPRPRRRRQREEVFTMVFQGHFGDLSKMGLTAQEWNVLARLIDTLGFEGPAVVQQQALAEELGTKQPNVSKALCSLEEKGIISRGESRGQWWVNAHVAWRGSPAGRAEQISKTD